MRAVTRPPGAPLVIELQPGGLLQLVAPSVKGDRVRLGTDESVTFEK
jgi:hypothetical protein